MIIFFSWRKKSRSPFDFISIDRKINPGEIIIILISVGIKYSVQMAVRDQFPRTRNVN